MGLQLLSDSHGRRAFHACRAAMDDSAQEWFDHQHRLNPWAARWAHLRDVHQHETCANRPDAQHCVRFRSARNSRERNLPGAIRTRISPPPGSELHQRQIAKSMFSRTGEPREVAWAAVFLASDESSFITGVTLPVDGGWMRVLIRTDSGIYETLTSIDLLDAHGRGRVYL